VLLQEALPPYERLQSLRLSMDRDASSPDFTPWTSTVDERLSSKEWAADSERTIRYTRLPSHPAASPSQERVAGCLHVNLANIRYACMLRQTKVVQLSEAGDHTACRRALVTLERMMLDHVDRLVAYECYHSQSPSATPADFLWRAFQRWDVSRAGTVDLQGFLYVWNSDLKLAELVDPMSVDDHVGCTLYVRPSVRAPPGRLASRRVFGSAGVTTRHGLPSATSG